MGSVLCTAAPNGEAESAGARSLGSAAVSASVAAWPEVANVASSSNDAATDATTMLLSLTLPIIGMLIGTVSGPTTNSTAAVKGCIDSRLQYCRRETCPHASGAGLKVSPFNCAI